MLGHSGMWLVGNLMSIIKNMGMDVLGLLRECDHLNSILGNAPWFQQSCLSHLVSDKSFAGC